MDTTAIARSVVEGRRMLIATDALAGATRMVALLRDLGAASVAVVSSIDGVGDLPTDVTSIRLPTAHSDTMMGGIRHFLSELAALPPEALDAWDPDRSALFLAGPFDGPNPVAGRRPFGARPPEFLALEDKMIIDDLWDRVGIARAPSRIVRSNRADLLAAASELDGDLGTVWVADNSEGWHGGGDYLRWVRGPEYVDAAVEFFGRHANHVRVMPFLDGIPCSIHGIVLPDRVLAFRPVEMIILRRPGEARIQYAGLATTWDPSPGDRAEMQDVVRRVGATIRSEVGYRGAFGIDGVMTRDGFRPTELNPRLSGGLGLQASQVADLHLGFINRLLLEGTPPELDWVQLKREVTDAADARRATWCITPLPHPRPAWNRIHLAWAGDRYEVVGDEDAADTTLSAGDHTMGCALLTEAIPGRTAPGQPFGPRVVAALDVARHHGVDVPELMAATDVR